MITFSKKMLFKFQNQELKTPRFFGPYFRIVILNLHIFYEFMYELFGYYITLFSFLPLLLTIFFVFCKSSNETLEKCKTRIELIANTLQLEGFSRVDAFVNVDSGEVSRAKF